LLYFGAVRLDPLISANAIVASANIAVLIALLILYAKVYKSSKAKFTIGLMLFVSLLMLHNIIAVYGYFMMESLYAPTLIPYFLAIHVAELGGLLVLFRITLL
jgi:cadmium resistance protein CadD (predicted permease)